MPDDRFGEELCAWLRLKQGAAASKADIRAFSKGEIAHFKIPRYIRLVDEFPMTVTGKMQQFAMRRQRIETLGWTPQRTA